MTFLLVNQPFIMMAVAVAKKLNFMKIITKSIYLLFISLLLTSCSLLTAAGITSQGQPTKEVEDELSSTTANSSVNVDHSEWDRLLNKHVNQQGFVDYKGFQNDRTQLKHYLHQLSELNPDDDWSVQELLAYYINLYNAATVKLILDNYPTNSIKDIDNAFTKAFVTIGNKELSLGGIENGVLRKMNEPRIHFAINCASLSCPKLLDEAYTAGSINEQLEKVTSEFINSGQNMITKQNPKLSKLFDWYGSDFKVDGNKNIIAYINQYSTTKIDPNTDYSFIEYNWNLNEQK